jgi:hypothetical protein
VTTERATCLGTTTSPTDVHTSPGMRERLVRGVRPPAGTRAALLVRRTSSRRQAASRLARWLSDKSLAPKIVCVRLQSPVRGLSQIRCADTAAARRRPPMRSPIWAPRSPLEATTTPLVIRQPPRKASVLHAKSPQSERLRFDSKRHSGPSERSVALDLTRCRCPPGATCGTDSPR